MIEDYAAFVRSVWAIDPETDRAAAVGHAFAMLVTECGEYTEVAYGWCGDRAMEELGDCCWALTALVLGLEARLPERDACWAVMDDWTVPVADCVQHWYQHGGVVESGDELHYALSAALGWILRECRDSGWTLDEVLAANMAKLRARYPDGFDLTASKERNGA